MTIIVLSQSPGKITFSLCYIARKCKAQLIMEIIIGAVKLKSDNYTHSISGIYICHLYFFSR